MSVDTAELDRLRHPDEAWATIRAHLSPLEPEQVPVAQSAWRVLAEDFVAPEDHPPFPASTMDGYAVVAADVSPSPEVLAADLGQHG